MVFVKIEIFPVLLNGSFLDIPNDHSEDQSTAYSRVAANLRISESPNLPVKLSLVQMSSEKPMSVRFVMGIQNGMPKSEDQSSSRLSNNDLFSHDVIFVYL
jgi:hypothetical protein